MARVSFNCTQQQVRRTAGCVALVVCGAVFLAGCTPLQIALWDSGTAGWQKTTPPYLAPKSPLHQMQAIVQKTAFWMSLVHTETAHDATPLQVWMTPDGEMLHLSAQGRVSSTFGTAYADWTRSRIQYAPANWKKVRDHLLSKKQWHYQRERDTHPGGFANIQERVTIHALSEAPKIDWPHPLPFTGQLHWFEEHTQLLDPAGRWSLLPASDADIAPMGKALPRALFAVAFLPDGREQVVYSEQCLSHAVCLRMQHWAPAQAAAPNP